MNSEKSEKWPSLGFPISWAGNQQWKRDVKPPAPVKDTATPNVGISSSFPGSVDGRVSAFFRVGISFLEEGEFRKAEQIFLEVLKDSPQHPEALHLLGLNAYKAGDFSQALHYFRQSIEKKNDHPVFHFNLGLSLRKAGHLEEAALAFQKAISLTPSHYPEACVQLGNTFIELEKMGEAKEAFFLALKGSPNDTRVLRLFADICQFQGELDEALNAYQRLLGLALDNPGDVHFQMGVILWRKNRIAEALGHFRYAQHFQPENPKALQEIGGFFYRLGRLSEAADCCRQSIDLAPDNPAAFFYLGQVFQAENNFPEAAECFRKALELAPDNPNVPINLAYALKNCGKSAEAADVLRQTIEEKPDHYPALNALVHQLQYLCEWKDYDALLSRLEEMTRKALENGGNVGEGPFENLTRTQDPARNLAVARRCSEKIRERALSGPEGMQFYSSEEDRSFRDTCKKRTIGYLSHDFRNHPVAQLMMGIFACHDRRRFTVNAYSYGENDNSYYRKIIQSTSDRFVEIRELSPWEAARKIREDKVDILVDLMGYTRNHRFEICAYRPAPIQVAYLGYPGTTGADFMDYIIVDRIVVPPEHASFFTEKLVTMPHSYIFGDGTQTISESPLRKQENLPEKGFVFCSFNQPYKIEPVLFDVWMNLLKQIPGSVLWTHRRPEPVPDNLRREAEIRGVSGDRVIFAERAPTKAGHIARIQLADLALDTRVYNGHVTTLDALWAGVPVVAQLGGHFASRAAASILSAVGLPELVAKNLQQYEALALQMARNPSELSTVRKKLERNKKTHPLFDTSRFTRNLESAFDQMWEIYVGGKSPRPLTVADVG